MVALCLYGPDKGLPTFEERRGRKIEVRSGCRWDVRRPAQLCADTRMTEKHYAHLAPSYVAQTIRGTFPVARADPDILEMIAIH